MANDYFSHDYNSRNDIKMTPLLEDHKLRGIGAYWCLVEMLYESKGYISMSKIKNIAFNLREREAFIRSIITDYELFNHDADKFWSEGVLSRIKLRKEKSIKATESVNKRWHKDTNVLPPENNGNALNKNKENKNKEKESEINYIRFRDKIHHISISEFIKQNFEVFLQQWQMQNKDVSLETIFKKMDEDYVCYTFNSENHIQNSFKSTYEKIKNKKSFGKKEKEVQTTAQNID